MYVDVVSFEPDLRDHWNISGKILLIKFSNNTKLNGLKSRIAVTKKTSYYKKTKSQVTSEFLTLYYKAQRQLTQIINNTIMMKMLTSSSLCKTKQF